MPRTRSASAPPRSRRRAGSLAYQGGLSALSARIAAGACSQHAHAVLSMLEPEWGIIFSALTSHLQAPT
eukprot:271318-Rhodomonas_salina.1